MGIYSGHYRSDAIAVEMFSFALLWRNICTSCHKTFSNCGDGHYFFGYFLGSSESTGTLLIHFGSRCLECWIEYKKGFIKLQKQWHFTTPSIAMYNSFLGRTMANIRSIHSKMAIIISSSFLGAGLKFMINQILTQTNRFINYGKRNRTLPVLRMCARMNDAIHVKV